MTICPTQPSNFSSGGDTENKHVPDVDETAWCYQPKASTKTHMFVLSHEAGTPAFISDASRGLCVSAGHFLSPHTQLDGAFKGSLSCFEEQLQMCQNGWQEASRNKIPWAITRPSRIMGSLVEVLGSHAEYRNLTIIGNNHSSFSE